MPSLSKLLDMAIKNKLILDEGITQARRIIEREQKGYLQWKEIMELTGEESESYIIVHKPQEYITLLAKTFPDFRNEMAHGSNYLSPHGYLTLEICRDIINQLFNEKAQHAASGDLA